MDVAESVQTEDLRAYLQLRGWANTKTDDRKEIWAAPNESGRVLLPVVRFDDYVSLMREALGRISAIENRALEDLVVDLEWPAYDKLVARTRVDRASPAVPLQEALGLNGALRDLVVAAARSAENPQPSHRGGWSNMVGSYLDLVQMLPSRPGSFSLRALLPLNDSSPEDLLLPTVSSPNVRRVTQTLWSGVQAAVKAAIERISGEDDTVFERAVDRGVSADLLDALVRLGGPEIDPSPVELTVDWTYASPAQPLEPLWIASGLMPTLAHGADVLRGTPDEVDAMVVGLVVRLHRRQPLGPGEITVQGFVDSRVESSTRHVRIELDEGTYGLAIEAHRAGRTVACRCVIRFGGPRIEVMRIESFEVLSA